MNIKRQDMLVALNAIKPFFEKTKLMDCVTEIAFEPLSASEVRVIYFNGVASINIALPVEEPLEFGFTLKFERFQRLVSAFNSDIKITEVKDENQRLLVKSGGSRYKMSYSDIDEYPDVLQANEFIERLKASKQGFGMKIKKDLLKAAHMHVEPAIDKNYYKEHFRSFFIDFESMVVFGTDTKVLNVYSLPIEGQPGGRWLALPCKLMDAAIQLPDEKVMIAFDESTVVIAGNRIQYVYPKFFQDDKEEIPDYRIPLERTQKEEKPKATLNPKTLKDRLGRIEIITEEDYPFVTLKQEKNTLEVLYDGESNSCVETMPIEGNILQNQKYSIEYLKRGVDSFTAEKVNFEEGSQRTLISSDDENCDGVIARIKLD